jgi:predicted RNA-binding Zn-ribbon protein involved in translation (DUF1610 family)
MPAYTYDLPDDTETRCTSCQRPLYDTELDRWACRVCEDNARTQLGEMTALYAQLGGRLVPSTGAPSTGHVTGATRTPPLPAALAPLSMRGPGGMTALLQAVEDSWRQTLGWTVAPFRGNTEQTLAGVVTFLDCNVGWACSRYDEVAEDLKTIRQIHTNATAIVNGTIDTRIPVGCCPAVNLADGTACAQPLKVSPWALHIRCGGCGTTWQRDEWLRLGAAMRGLAWPPAAAVA